MLQLPEMSQISFLQKVYYSSYFQLRVKEGWLSPINVHPYLLCSVHLLTKRLTFQLGPAFPIIFLLT